MITADKFEDSVGCKPETDDLARCNCLRAGTIGHEQCGWDYLRDMPVFISGVSRRASINKGYTGGPMQTTQELIDEYNSRRRTERIMAGIKPLLLIVLGILLGVCAVTYTQDCAASKTFFRSK